MRDMRSPREDRAGFLKGSMYKPALYRISYHVTRQRQECVLGRWRIPQVMSRTQVCTCFTPAYPGSEDTATMVT